MAYVLVDPSGKNNAKVGDKVVTGGGIYEKMKDGTSKLIQKLSTATGTTKNYSDVVEEYNKLTNGSNTTPTVKTTVDGTVKETVKVDSVDPNGIATVTVAGYDPADYSTSYKTTSSSTGLGNIMGYVVLGLLGIALLDRFMNSKGR